MWVIDCHSFETLKLYSFGSLLVVQWLPITSPPKGFIPSSAPSELLKSLPHELFKEPSSSDKLGLWPVANNTSGFSLGCSGMPTLGSTKSAKKPSRKSSEGKIWYPLRWFPSLNQLCFQIHRSYLLTLCSSMLVWRSNLQWPFWSMYVPHFHHSMH